MKKLMLILLPMMIAYSCNQNRPSGEAGKARRAGVNSVVVDKTISDSIELEISDIARDFRLVRLETSRSILLGNIYTIVLGENYLVIGTERDYFLFDRDGKYIRRLLITGRGPGEFIMPQFSSGIRNDILFISDPQQSRRYIYCIDLKTGSQSRILKANEESIQSFLPDSDSTFLIITGKPSIEKKTIPSISIESTLLRQNFKGNLIKEIPLGVIKGYGPFLPSGYSFFNNNGEILIESYRCDSVLKYSGQILTQVWRNTYLTNFDENLPTQKVPEAHLVHFGSDTLMMWISNNEYRIGNRSMGRGGKVQFLLMDRLNDRLFAVKKLYFLDRDKPINIARINLLDNEQFAMVILAADVDNLLKNPRFKGILEKLLIQDSSHLSVPISPFDNPFILFGQFK